ncbi:hypothetical protein [Rheinheimera maricola]|uniref:SPOR domain-containing protein n=1 Tax=Rheinheimera maricola TaxID=2793282 RepID=A0ABS7X6L3_9GAMM|nr:hypothetical protein [Rheinheimera maricola]MBZ9611184.1 hypothetical protein [Rheinheimera maricola]
MDITELQARLKDFKHLLPSQREWVERLLFQLAFNEVSYVEAIGADGSGKSTLALTLAELFSEQYNVALVSNEVAMSELASQLMQQWFSLPIEPDVSLRQQIEQQEQTKPLLVILDQAISEPAVLSKYIRSLPCLVFNFSTSSMQRDGLTLLLGVPGSADAEYLLAGQKLNPLEVTKRLAVANGNLHRLLQPQTDNAEQRVLPTKRIAETISLRVVSIALAIFSLLTISYVFWPERTVILQPEAVEGSTEPKVINANLDAALDAALDATVVLAPHNDNVVLDSVNSSSDDGAANIAADNNNSEDQATIRTSDSSTEPTALGTDKVDTGGIETGSKAQSTSSDLIQSDVISDISTYDALKQPTSNTTYQYDEAKLLLIDKQQNALQLAVLSNEAALQRFREAYAEVLPLVYQRNWQGKTQLVLLLAPFNNSSEAKQKLAELPEALRKTGPFVKRMQSVQAEIGAKTLSQQSSLE